jgi:hypothetical protein
LSSLPTTLPKSSYPKILGNQLSQASRLSVAPWTKRMNVLFQLRRFLSFKLI